MRVVILGNNYEKETLISKNNFIHLKTVWIRLICWSLRIFQGFIFNDCLKFWCDFFISSCLILHKQIYLILLSKCICIFLNTKSPKINFTANRLSTFLESNEFYPCEQKRKNVCIDLWFRARPASNLLKKTYQTAYTIQSPCAVSKRSQV